MFFMRKPNTHPCLPTRIPLGCPTLFSYSVRLTTLVFASSWKAIPTQTTWSIVPHSMVKKECVVRVNSRVMFLQCTCHSFEFLHLTVFVETRCFARLVFCDPRRDDVAFVFCFLFSFFSLRGLVLIKVSLYVKGCLERGAFN
jgi:hypothetical protein